MSAELLTPADLAAVFNVPAAKVMEWRRTYGWPCVRAGRTIRFTPAQVEQIIASHSVAKAEGAAAVVVAGQTPRSAARRSA